MNKKLYQTAGQKDNDFSNLINVTNGIPKNYKQVGGKLINTTKTGLGENKVSIGVYYIKSDGTKVLGFPPVKGTVPRQNTKKLGGVMQYKYGGPKMYQQAGVNAMQNTRPIAYGQVGAGLGYYSAGSPSRRETGGMYDNTVSAAGQGGPQLGVSSTIVGQETDPAIQQARLQGLQQSTSTLGENAQGLISQTRHQESIDQQQAEVEAMKAEQQSQQQTSALEGIAGRTAQTIGQNLYPNQGGGLGSAVKAAQTAAKYTKAANLAGQAAEGTQLGVQTAQQAQAGIEAAKIAADIGGTVNEAGQVVNAAGEVMKTGSAVGTGLKSFATSGAGIGTIANLAGRGISALSDDDDPTKSNVGEYSGQILQSAGTGATIGSFFPGPGTAIGAGIGAAIGAGKQYFGTKKAKKAQNKYEGEARVRRNTGIRDLNKRVGSLYGSHMSNVAAGNLAQKTISGQNLGRNVMYRHGGPHNRGRGMMMAMPRYGYNY